MQLPGWNIFANLINEGCGIRMSCVEYFLKINKRVGTSLRDLRVSFIGHRLCKHFDYDAKKSNQR